MNYVSLTLKALTPLLDPVLGQNVELGFCKWHESERHLTKDHLSFYSFSRPVNTG
jgi:hypothetical protein